MTTDWTTRGTGVTLGAFGGPLIVGVGYLLGAAIHVRWGEFGLLGLLALPFLLAVPFVIMGQHRRDAIRFMIGAAIGIVIMVVIVGGGISLLGLLLSDPAPGQK